KPNDSFYVTYGASQAWSYYAPRLGLANHRVIHGVCRMGDPRSYFVELEGLGRSGRVWLVFALGARLPTPEPLVPALSMRGTRLRSLPVGQDSSNVSAHLFDLGGPPSLPPNAPFPPSAFVNSPTPCHGPAVVERDSTSAVFRESARK